MEDKVDALIKRLGWCKKIDNGITLKYFKGIREGDYIYIIMQLLLKMEK